MNSASYEYCKMSARIGLILFPFECGLSAGKRQSTCFRNDDAGCCPVLLLAGVQSSHIHEPSFISSWKELGWKCHCMRVILMHILKFNNCKQYDMKSRRQFSIEEAPLHHTLMYDNHTLVMQIYWYNKTERI